MTVVNSKHDSEGNRYISNCLCCKLTLSSLTIVDADTAYTEKMCVIFVVALYLSSVTGLISPYLPSTYEDVVCACGVGYNATLSAYFPVLTSNDVADYTDRAGAKLHSLQEFLDGRSPFVTASMDRGLNLPYGTALCIPELNRHYRRRVNIEVRDTHSGLDGFGTSRVVICVRSEADSYDLAVNRPVKVIIEKQ